MTTELTNCGIPTNYALNLKEKYMMNWVDAQTTSLYRVLFSSMATFLKTVQTKTNKKTVLSLKDSNGQFKVAAIMIYHESEGESDDDKGNWTLDFTFDEKDTADADMTYDSHCDAFYIVACKECHSIMNGRFQNQEYCGNVFCEAITVLTDWLDTNAKADETVEVILPGVFEATVGIEKGKKVMGIVPGEIIKQMIKSDDIL